MRLLLIGCGLLIRELSDAIVRSPHLIDATFLPAGLHDTGAKSMRQRIQQEIDGANASDYDAIVLGYALCGMGIAGLKAPSIPLVVARAHDCITLLMGSREKYSEYFKANTGVYFRSVAWVERGRECTIRLGANGLSQDRDALIARYGEDAGQYLYEEATRYQRSLQQADFIRTGSEFDDRCMNKRSRKLRKRTGHTKSFPATSRSFAGCLRVTGNRSFSSYLRPPEIATNPATKKLSETLRARPPEFFRSVSLNGRIAWERR